jgi:signal transduction histidine kinase
MKVLQDLTDRKRMEDDLRRARDELEAQVAERTADLQSEIEHRKDLSRRLGTAQEDERRRVSRDLHDTIGQLMAGLSLAFKAVETSGHLPAAAAAKLAEAQQVANALGKEVNALAVRLRPTALDDVELEPALGQLVTEWSARAGIPADFQAVGLGPGRLPADVETAIYRVVQEALTNVARHAGAAQVSVTVTRSTGLVTAVVEDDGAGFDPAEAPDGRLGLLGMRERVALVGGEADVESSPGGGTVVLARIPVPEGGVA